VVSFSLAPPCPHGVTDNGNLCAGQQTAMKPAQLLQLAESIAAKQVARAQASGKMPSQDCVLLHCALLQVSNARSVALCQGLRPGYSRYDDITCSMLLAAVVDRGKRWPVT